MPSTFIHDSRNRSRNPFSIFGLSPDIVAHPPQEPYLFLSVGAVIQAGDIKRIAGSEGDAWDLVSDHEVGHTVPGSGIAYARVCCPELFRLSREDEIVVKGDMYWFDGNDQWSVISDGELIGTNVGELCELNAKSGRRLFVATKDKQVSDARVIEVPARHRALWVGETVRWGDKVIYDGQSDWEPTTLTDRGSEVKAATAENDYIRYCRPIDASHNNWYVDPGGEGGGLGGYEDPFGSLNDGIKQIEKSIMMLGTSLFGTVWHVSGSPLYVFDLPEPKLPDDGRGDDVVDELVPPEIVAKARELAAEGTLAAPRGYITQQSVVEGSEVVDDEKTSLPPLPPKEPVQDPLLTTKTLMIDDAQIQLEVLDLSEADSGSTIESIVNLAEANRTLPKGFELLAKTEQIGSGDLMFFDFGDEIFMWIPLADEYWGREAVDAGIGPFARRIKVEKPDTDPKLIGNILGRLDDLASDLQKVTELVESLKNAR